jgi:hypothetical protein
VSPATTPATPAEVAGSAAEAVRTLGRLTLSRSGYLTPAEVASVVGELATLVHRLPQVLDQAEGWLRWAHREGLVQHDAEDTPGGSLTDLAVSQAATGLALTATLAIQLAEHLESVRSWTVRLTGGAR